ncbi:MAG: class I SAM-dependent methyltransferase [Spirochaetaceae bacterium]|nr:MAG: class I SAM-dependent methyltransferase [Spirochaetaceae bacterium]
MDFYESISAYYDLIFPVDPQTTAFLSSRVRPHSLILDIACGTGGYSIALAEQGHRVTGVDLDRAMIDAARGKLLERELEVEFRVLDMLAMTASLSAGFDLAFCIGNSLVHLESEEQIRQLLGDCRFLLRPGGTLIVQIINYDRILAEGLTSLPTLHDEAAGLEFLRSYDLDPKGGVVIFSTELRIGTGAKRRVIHNRIPLRILTRDRLLELAGAAGFQDFELFGSFGAQPLSLQSLPLILCARSG